MEPMLNNALQLWMRTFQVECSSWKWQSWVVIGGNSRDKLSIIDGHEWSQDLRQVTYFPHLEYENYSTCLIGLLWRLSEIMFENILDKCLEIGFKCLLPLCYLIVLLGTQEKPWSTSKLTAPGKGTGYHRWFIRRKAKSPLAASSQWVTKHGTTLLLVTQNNRKNPMARVMAAKDGGHKVPTESGWLTDHMTREWHRTQSFMPSPTKKGSIIKRSFFEWWLWRLYVNHSAKPVAKVACWINTN